MSVFTVSQLNGYTKSLLEEDALLSDVTVSGEISNFKRHSSGHLYFSLKDEHSAIQAVMFKWQAMYLRISPANGMKVVARGKVTMYEATGTYQIVLASMQPDGVGALYAAYEKLKTKLEGEGLFSPECKKKIPNFPQKIGVVTSRTGAAVQDILNILGRRYPLAEVVLCPVMVQGAEAAGQLRRAVRMLNAKNACDVIIIGRGGGSIEDLWAFNDEALAREIAASHIPVISAVGHETDFTICDFAADLRAPTPSAAAELAVPSADGIGNFIRLRMTSLKNYMESIIDKRNLKLRMLAGKPCFSSPMYQVEVRAQKLDLLTARINAAVRSSVSRDEKRLASAAARISALNPMGVLARGFCAASNEGGIITAASDVKTGDELDLRFSDGTVNCRVTDIKGV